MPTGRTTVTLSAIVGAILIVGAIGWQFRPVTWGAAPGQRHTVPAGHFTMERVDHVKCSLPADTTVVIKGTEPHHGVFVEIEHVPLSPATDCAKADQGFVEAQKGAGPYVAMWPTAE